MSGELVAEFLVLGPQPADFVAVGPQLLAERVGGGPFVGGQNPENRLNACAPARIVLNALPVASR